MSYGYNAPRGLIPSQYLNGTSWSGQQSPYNILSGLAASIRTGDPVIFDGNGGITLATAGTGNLILGVFQGVKYTDTSGIEQVLPNWTTGTVTLGAQPATAYVTDDPWLLYDIQIASGAGGGPVAAPSIALADLGTNANLNVAQGTTYNAVGGVVPPANPAAGTAPAGQSVWYLDSVGQGAGATIQVKIIRFTPRPGNIAALPFNNALCLINNSYYRAGTAGI